MSLLNDGNVAEEETCTVPMGQVQNAATRRGNIGDFKRERDALRALYAQASCPASRRTLRDCDSPPEGETEPSNEFAEAKS